MASDLRYQFVKTQSEERDNAKHVTIRLYVALDQTNIIRDVSLDIRFPAAYTC